MPNLQSGKKRLRQDKVREARNKQTKSRMRTAVKKVDNAILAGDVVAAQEALPQAVSQLAKTAKKGVIHARNASRKQSRLAIRLNKAVIEAATPKPVVTKTVSKAKAKAKGAKGAGASAAAS